jgi:acetoacetate decarboxylase
MLLRLLRLREAQRNLPAHVRLVPVLPGRTLGVVFCGRYEAGSTLRYDELICSPGLARCRGRLGWWISDIFVNETQALAGGRTHWGLPKQYARFDWRPDCLAISVLAQPSGKVVLELSCPAEVVRRGALPIPLLAPALCDGARAGLRFWVRGHALVLPRRGALRTALPGWTTRTRVTVLALTKLHMSIGPPG